VNVWEIFSIYRWQGEVRHGPEAAMLFKVTDEGFEALRSAILKVHPYDVPCIVRYPIAGGHGPFLDWISESIVSSPTEYQKPE
jgi:periplasmic divalent cation tolerance protein